MVIAAPLKYGSGSRQERCHANIRKKQHQAWDFEPRINEHEAAIIEALVKKVATNIVAWYSTSLSGKVSSEVVQITGAPL